MKGKDFAMPENESLGMLKIFYDVEDTFKDSEPHDNTPLQGELSTHYQNDDENYFEESAAIPEFINRILPSPINGKIINLYVKPGSKVTEKDLILIIENMKMRTNVYPKISGIISSVEVNTGDLVEQGDVLVIFR